MVDNESIKMKNIVSEGKHGDLIERNVTIDTKEVLNFINRNPDIISKMLPPQNNRDNEILSEGGGNLRPMEFDEEEDSSMMQVLNLLISNPQFLKEIFNFFQSKLEKANKQREIEIEKRNRRKQMELEKRIELHKLKNDARKKTEWKVTIVIGGAVLITISGILILGFNGKISSDALGFIGGTLLGSSLTFLGKFFGKSFTN